MQIINQLTNKYYQKGAFVLLFLLIVSVTLVVVLGSYILMLTNLTKKSFNFIRSEESFYAAIGGFRDTVTQSVARGGSNGLYLPSFAYNYKDTLKIENRSTIDEGKYVLTVTADNKGLLRSIEGNLETANSTKSKKLDVVIMLDVSDSMADEIDNLKNTKLDQAKDLALELISKLQTGTEPRIAIISYGDGVKILNSLTDNQSFETFSKKIADLHAGGHTNMAAALNTARDIIVSQPFDANRNYYVVLLTDGFPSIYWNEGQFVNCIDEYKVCLSKGQNALECTSTVGVACSEAAKNYTFQVANSLKSSSYGIDLITVGMGNLNEMNSRLLNELASGLDEANKYFYQLSKDGVGSIYTKIIGDDLTLGKLTFDEVRD